MQLLTLPPAIAMLAFATSAQASPGIAGYINRGFSFRPPEEAPVVPSVHPDDTPVPSYHPDDEPPSTGGSNTEGGLTSGNGGLEGGLVPPSTEDIPYEPASSPNSCFSSEKCKEVTEDLAEEVLEKLLDAITNAISPSSTASGTLTLVTSLSRPTLTGNVSTTTTSTPTAIYPNADLASSVISTGLTQPYMALLDSDEQEMYIDEPVCFFANAMRMYSSAASVTATSTPTAALNQRNVLSCLEAGVVCTSTSETPLPTSATASLQSQFFATELPNQLVSVYVQQTGAMGTYATTCTGFDGTTTYETSYVRREEVTPTQATYTQPPSTGGSGRVGRDGWTAIVMLSGVLVGALGVLL